MRRLVQIIGGSAIISVLPGCGGGGGSQPSIIPAQDRIVYQSTAGGDSEIFLMNGDGTGQIPLTTNTAFDADPKFNRSGSKIVFTSNRDGNNEIYMMDSDGQNPVNLTRNEASDSDPAFSPDGSKIVFVSDRHATGSALPSDLELYLMNANGTGVKRLTNNATFDGDPVFSPDGHTIVFSSQRNNNQEICALDLTTLKTTNLTQNAALDRFPNFTADGTHIVFVSDRTGNADIFNIDTNGQNLVNLTNHPSLDTDPVVSPDGQRLIFASARSGTLELYSMPLKSGANPKPLTTATGSERFPDIR